MKIIRLDRFVRDYQSLSQELQKKTDKTIRFLLQHPRYPSMQIKKMGGQKIWEARVTKGYRLTFEIWDHTLFPLKKS